MRHTLQELGKLQFDMTRLCRLYQPDTVERGEQCIAARRMKDGQ